MERLRSREIKMSQTNYQWTAMSYIRTPEHRRLRAKLIRKWKPWLRSTGAATPEGKAKVLHNDFKEGLRGTLREISVLLREQRKFLKSVLK